VHSGQLSLLTSAGWKVSSILRATGEGLEKVWLIGAVVCLLHAVLFQMVAGSEKRENLNFAKKCTAYRHSVTRTVGTANRLSNKCRYAVSDGSGKILRN